MNIHRLSTRVTAVPSSDHQRMASSLPRGKNNSTSANAVGTKMTSDIRIRSYSTMAYSAYQFPPSPPLRGRGALTSPRRGLAQEVEEQHKDPHRRQHQEQHVAAQVPRLQRPHPAAHGLGHPGQEVGHPVDDAQ